VATTNDLKNGMCLDIEGTLWTVIEFQHVKPGKGPAFVRTKMRQVLTGKVVEKTFNAGVKIEVAILEKREMQFLYKEGEDFVFMDNKTFDQMNISAATVGDSAQYMLENTEAIVAIHENNPLYIELPASVVLTVTYTEPGLQGDRSSGGTKPATVETGIQIQVPLFIKQDEKVLVDTRDGSYLGRAN
jgi:elongation factor P